MSFKAVLFDVGETLWHSADPPAAADLRKLSTCRVRAVMEAEGLVDVDPEEVAVCGFHAVDDAVRRARGGSLVEPDYGAVARDAFLRLGLDTTESQARSLIQAAYVSGPESGKRAAADARSTLDELHARGLLLATVTNRAFGGSRFLADLAEAGLDVPWRAQAISADIGFLKPRPEIFHHALDALGVRTNEALMVGNSLLEDIAGAQKLGIAAAWLRSAPDAEGVVPDYVLESVSDLLTIPELEGPDA